MKNRIARITAVAAMLFGIGVMSVGVASATPQGCATVVHNNTEGVTLTAGGKATATADGLKMETPAIPDAVNWASMLTTPVPLKGIEDLSYRTRKLAGDTNAAALPAYRLYLGKLDGANETATIVYEPYYQIVGNPPSGNTTTWDVENGKWWSSKSFGNGPTAYTGEGGGSYAGNTTLAQIIAANPSAVVLGFGVGQGTYNAGTIATANDVKFDAKSYCKKHTWVAAPASSSSSSASASASASSSSKPPSQSASASKSASASATASASSSSKPAVVPTNPGSNVGNNLPLTGASVPMIAGGGILAVLAGAALFYFGWYRKPKVETIA